MDELSLDARDQCQVYHPDVGYLSGKPRTAQVSRSCVLTASNTGLQAEGADAFSQFHLYVCSAFLVKWSEKLQKMDFQVSSRDVTQSPVDRWLIPAWRPAGNHNVFAETANGYMERPRRRVALVRGVRAQVCLAGRRESF